MKPLAKLILASSLVFSATPTLAFTTLPSSATPSTRQFADPDAALDNLASSARDDMLAGGSRGQIGSSTSGTTNFDGSTTREDDGAQPATAERSGASLAGGWMPGLNGADLYDGEPPFMPTVVGEHQP